MLEEPRQRWHHCKLQTEITLEASLCLLYWNTLFSWFGFSFLSKKKRKISFIYFNLPIFWTFHAVASVSEEKCGVFRCRGLECLITSAKTIFKAQSITKWLFCGQIWSGQCHLHTLEQCDKQTRPAGNQSVEFPLVFWVDGWRAQREPGCFVTSTLTLTSQCACLCPYLTSRFRKISFTQGFCACL